MPRVEFKGISKEDIEVGGLLTLYGLRKYFDKYVAGFFTHNKVVKISESKDSVELRGFNISDSFAIATALENIYKKEFTIKEYYDPMEY